MTVQGRPLSENTGSCGSAMVVGMHLAAVTAHQVQNGRCMPALGSSLMTKLDADM